MRTFKQIGEVSPDMGHYTYPRFRKPVDPAQEGEIIKLKYTDGREDTIYINKGSCDACKGCMYAENGYSCPVWLSDRKEVWCMIGPGHIAVSINKIMEGL